MDIFHFFWYDVLTKPLYNLLLFVYVISPYKYFGFSLVVVTVLMRLLLLPFSLGRQRSEQRLNAIKPKLAEIENTYKNNIEVQREKTKELLAKNNIGIYSGLFSLALQGLLLAVLYQIFTNEVQPLTSGLTYSFFSIAPGDALVDTTFFNLFDTLEPSLWMSFIASALLLIQMGSKKVSLKALDSSTDRWMLYLLPLVTFFATTLLPASKALFIATSVLFSLALAFFTWLLRSMGNWFVSDEG